MEVEVGQKQDSVHGKGKAQNLVVYVGVVSALTPRQ